MSHPLVTLAASCLAETDDGLVLWASAPLANAVEAWALRTDGREAIRELLCFAVHVGEEWRSPGAAVALIDLACRATPVLAARIHDEEANRISGGTGCSLLRTAPCIEAPAPAGTIRGHALMLCASPRRRA
jgi:hypothetical protein